MKRKRLDFQPGDWVRLKRSVSKDRTKAKIVHYLTGVEGGVLLDRPIDLFSCWNVADLIRVAQ